MGFDEPAVEIASSVDEQEMADTQPYQDMPSPTVHVKLEGEVTGEEDDLIAPINEMLKRPLGERARESLMAALEAAHESAKRRRTEARAASAVD